MPHLEYHCEIMDGDAQFTLREVCELSGADERIVVVDTRSETDRGRAPLEFARPLDSDLMAELSGVDRKTPLVFVCNKGLSSRDVAEHYRKQGFTEVYNLEGGVEKLAG